MVEASESLVASVTNRTDPYSNSDDLEAQRTTSAAAAPTPDTLVDN